MTKTARGITIDDEIWDKVRKQAHNENRPISNFVETIIIKYFEEVENKKKTGE